MGRDVSEFSDFVVARCRAMLRTAYLLTGDHGHAEDLVQTTLAKCFVAWPRLRARKAADAYVRKAMLNTYLSWRRKKSWHEIASDAPPDREGADSTEGLAQRSDVMAALAGLPPRQRAVVVLRFYEDLGVDQVADQMGCSAGSIKRQTSVALSKLRHALGEIADAVGEESLVEGKGRR
jgi:RNA polymerase sigma-70 factor (sigma-E family)